MNSKAGIFRTACILLALGIAAGAFGAHGLKNVLKPEYMKVYETGVFYHLLHALALLALASCSIEKLKLRNATYLIVFGIIIFSGSLYLLAITEIKKLGMITPIGGLSFICAWIYLAFAKHEGNTE